MLRFFYCSDETCYSQHFIAIALRPSTERDQFVKEIEQNWAENMNLFRGVFLNINCQTKRAAVVISNRI